MRAERPRDAVDAIKLSRATYRKVIQNLVWATGTWGLDLPMAIGAIGMSVWTIVVAANAQLLRRLQLRRDAPAVQPKLATA